MAALLPKVAQIPKAPVDRLIQAPSLVTRGCPECGQPRGPPLPPALYRGGHGGRPYLFGTPTNVILSGEIALVNRAGWRAHPASDSFFWQGSVDPEYNDSIWEVAHA